MRGTQAAQEPDAASVGQRQVEEHEVVSHRVDAGPGVGEHVHPVDGVTLGGGVLAQRGSEARVVLDQKDPARRRLLGQSSRSGLRG